MKKHFPVLQYINVPNVITTLGLVFGIIASSFLVIRDFRLTLIFMFFATCMDLVDGFFAGKLNQQSEFGKHVDSLVDYFICCVMPMMMVHIFLDGGVAITAGVIFFCVCGLWRLAHYNVAGGGSHFNGLPVPGGGMMVIMGIWSVVYYNLPPIICALIFFAVGIMMISTIQLPKYGLWQKMLWGVGLIFLILIITS